MDLFKYSALLIAIILLQGCGQKISNQILTTLENCDLESCTFEMAKLTDFQWSQVYVFDEYSDPEYISSIIGIEWSGEIVPDGNKRLFFVEDGEVIYFEDYSPNRVNIQFRPMDWMNDEVAKYTKSQAVFIVILKETKPNTGIFFYDLYPLNGTLKPNE